MTPSYFLNPDGQIVEVPADQAPALAGANGYLPASPKQVAEYQAQQKYGAPGQQVIAGLEGLGRGLTARLSTPLEVALGASPEGIQGRMEANPATAAISEGVGVAAPLLATAGTGGALRGAAELTAPALIAKAGQAAGAKVASRIGSLALSGGVEGALYGAGNVAHEAALGDPHLTAEAVLAQVGLSAALGGGLGAVFGGTEALLSKAISKAKTATSDLATGIATPEKLKDLAQSQHEALGAALKEAHGVIRPEEIAATIRTPPEIAQGELIRMTSRLDDVAANMRAHPELFPQAMYPAKLEAIRDSLIPKGLTELPDLTAETIFTALNDAKQTLDKQLGKWGKFIAPEQQDAIAAIRGVRTELKSALENTSIWGEAGARQSAFNDAQSAYFDSLKDFRKEFMIKKPGRGIAPVYEMDAGKLARLSDTANPRYPMRQDVWNNYQEQAKNLLNEIETSAAHAPSSDFDKQAVTSLINKAGDMEQAARQQGAILRMLGRLGGIGPTSTIAGGIVGGPLGGAIGVGLDLAIKGAKHIPQAVNALSHLNENNEAVVKAIESAATSLVKGSAKAARAAKGEVVAGIGRAFGDDVDTASASFEKHAKKLRALTSDPEQMQNALEKQIVDLHSHAPQTAQALQITSARAMAFLASKLPQTIKPGPLAKELPPSASQIATFNRYKEAIEHPLVIMQQARAGTLTPEAVEAVQFAYPQLYRQIQAGVVEALSVNDEVPYRTRLMLGMIMGHDMDGTANPIAIIKTQALFRPPMMPGGPAKPSKAGAGKISLPTRTRTSAQSASMGSK